MNFDLKGDKLCYLRPVFRRRFVREETVEVIVPDAQPDILRILDTDGMVFMRSKDSEAGRVTVTGTAELTVLYVPESGSGVKKLNVSIPFSTDAEGADITSDQLIVARLSLTSADARTVNPRKVVVRAEIGCEAELYLTETVYNTAPRERENVYFRGEDRTMTLPAAVNEKTFVFTDQVRMPVGSEDIGEILRASTELSVESARAVGSKAMVKGNALTRILYESREGELCRESFTTPFSQIVDTDASGDIRDFDIRMCLTGVYVNRDRMDASATDALTVEIHAVAQCVTFRQTPATFVTDAYSTRYPIVPAVSDCEFECLDGRDTKSSSVTASIPAAGAQILAVSVKTGSWALRPADGGAVYSAALNVSVIYRDAAGEILSSGRKTELEEPVGPETSVELTVGEPTASVLDGSIEVRVPLELSLTSARTVTVRRIESVEIDEDTKLELGDLPNLTVTRATAGRDLWELAKSHMSTRELIREINGLDGEPEEGRVLLIPRCV